jgi:hypothetical protein
MSKKRGKSAKFSTPAASRIRQAGGSILIYALVVLVLLFLLERQPSSFIYVSF